MNDAVWFNEMCTTYHLTTKYVHTEITGVIQLLPNTCAEVTEFSTGKVLGDGWNPWTEFCMKPP